MAPANWPQLIVEGGFPTVPPVQQAGTFILGDPVDGVLGTSMLGTAVTWSDLSQWVRSGNVSRSGSRQRGPLWAYQPGTASITLTNGDGRFDPDNLSGPYVAAGQTELTAMVPVRARAVWNGVTYPLFSGFADSWQPEDGRNYGGRYAEATVSATDGQKVLSGITLPVTGATGAGEDTGARVTRVLNAAGWYTGTGQRQVDTGNSTVQAYAGGDTAWNLMQAAADAEIGELYLDGSGALVYRNRHAILTDSRSITPQAVLGDSIGTPEWASALGPIGAPYLVSAAGQSSSASLTALIPPRVSVAAGDAIIVAAVATSGQATGVTDSEGNTYTLARSQTANGWTVRLYAAFGVSPLAQTVDSITVTYSSGTGLNSWGAIGCSGITPSVTAIDVTPVASGSSASPSLASGTLRQPNELVTAILVSPSLPAWAAGWTDVADFTGGSGTDISFAAQAVTAVTPVTASASITSAPWNMLVISLSGASGSYLPELPYSSLARARDDTTLANDVQATRTGGSMQEVQDAASIAKYLFPRTYPRSGLILQDDTTTLHWAQWVLYVAQGDDDRFDSLAISPLRDPVNLWPQVLGRKIGDRIQVWRRPPGVAPVVKDCFIRGTSHAWDWSAGTWVTTWTLQDATRYGSFLTLDDPVLGQLGANALAY